MCVPLSFLWVIWVAIIRSVWVPRTRTVMGWQPLALQLGGVAISWLSAQQFHPPKVTPLTNLHEVKAMHVWNDLLMTDVSNLVRNNIGKLNTNTIFPLLKICHNLYYACPKYPKYFHMAIFLTFWCFHRIWAKQLCLVSFDLDEKKLNIVIIDFFCMKLNCWRVLFLAEVTMFTKSIFRWNISEMWTFWF